MDDSIVMVDAVLLWSTELGTRHWPWIDALLDRRLELADA